MTKAQDAAHDAAQLAMLQSLPQERLDGILAALGVPQEHRDAAHRKADPRRCLECGMGYLRCRNLDSKVPEAERHDWQPDRGRADG